MVTKWRPDDSYFSFQEQRKKKPSRTNISQFSNTSKWVHHQHNTLIKKKIQQHKVLITQNFPNPLRTNAAQLHRNDFVLLRHRRDQRKRNYKADLVSVLWGDYIGVDTNGGSREQLTESPKLGIGFILRAGSSDLRGWLGGDGGAASDGGTS